MIAGTDTTENSHKPPRKTGTIGFGPGSVPATKYRITLQNVGHTYIKDNTK